MFVARRPVCSPTLEAEARAGKLLLLDQGVAALYKPAAAAQGGPVPQPDAVPVVGASGKCVLRARAHGLTIDLRRGN